MFIAKNLRKDPNIQAWKGVHMSVPRGGNVS